MKVTIITPTYNSAATLARAMQIVARQTYPDIEHIIVDGDSADATMMMVREWASQHPNVRFLSEPDSGVYDAINKGIRMATGDVIGFLNSDDCFTSPDAVAHIVEAMERDEADILYADLIYCRYEETGMTTVRNWRTGEFRPSRLSWGWMPPHPTLYCRRRVYDELGLYDTSYRIAADYEFILRAFSRPYRITYLPECLINMQIGGLSNRNVKNLLCKTREDARALRQNKRSIFTLFLKKARKISQYFR